MPPVLALNAWPFALASVATIWLFGVAWTQRKRPNVPYFLVLIGTAALWTVLALIYHLSEGVFERHLILHLRYIPIAMLPVSWLLFSLAYSGDIDMVRITHILVLVLVPVASLFLLATNANHHLFFLSYSIASSDSGPLINHVYGSWFWIHTYYSYLLLAAGALNMGATLLRSSAALRGRAVLMLAGACFPWAVNLGYLALHKEFGGIDPTPAAFAVTTLFFGVGVFRLDVLELMPVSRSRVFVEARDPILVVNAGGKVLDLNASAQRLFGQDCRNMVGRDLPDRLAPLWRDREAGKGVVTLPVQGQECRHAWRSSPLQGRNGKAASRQGHLYVLIDVESDRALVDRLGEQARESLAQADDRGAALETLRRQYSSRLEGIAGLSLCMQQELKGEHAGYARVIHESAVRLSQVLQDVLRVMESASDRPGALEPGSDALRKMELSGPRAAFEPGSDAPAVTDPSSQAPISAGSTPDRPPSTARMPTAGSGHSAGGEPRKTPPPVPAPR